ncbi:hypothetical protein AVEN_240972-1 [Araneus ventricosus]|uniref:DUF4817 domain-containing protein n=1 Tax=Araneus ventricosus TaxID=182803 RepID=A0A4Y2V0Z1_ARAVE|nr:hypothetical protein AVEN_240972-1 [Araneus ventricosus]
MATVQEKAMCVLWFFETKSVITTQRRFRTTYKKDPPSDNSIRRWLTQFQETGSVLHRKGAGRPSTSQENVDRIQETFTRSPRNVCEEHCVQDPSFVEGTGTVDSQLTGIGLSGTTPQKRKRRLRPLEYAGRPHSSQPFLLYWTRPGRLQLDCSENVDEEAVEQWINEDSALECFEVSSDDDTVDSRLTGIGLSGTTRPPQKERQIGAVEMCGKTAFFSTLPIVLDSSSRP